MTQDYSWDIGGVDILLDKHAASVVARRLFNREVTARTFERWFRYGSCGIPLPSIRVGRRRVTSEAAMRWWVEQLNTAQPVGGAR